MCCCLAAVSRGGIAIDVYWFIGGKLPLNLWELLLRRWILFKSRHERKHLEYEMERCNRQTSGGRHQGSSPSATSQPDVDEANSISIKICLFFYASTSFFLYVLFSFNLVSFFSCIKVIPFYVFQQQMNQVRLCAKVNKCITHPQKSSVIQFLFELKTKAFLFECGWFRCLDNWMSWSLKTSFLLSYCCSVLLTFWRVS